MTEAFSQTGSHILLVIAYDGAAYLGWQKTKEGPSVEATLGKTLEQIFQQPIHLQAASRTDRGVHAEWQVVDFYLTKPCKDIRRLSISLNQMLPPDIRCRHALYAPIEPFHPTLDVVSKTYRYLITAAPVQLPHLRHTHWHVHYDLNRSLLYKAAPLFVGQHDFRGLCNQRADLNEEDTVRTVHEVLVTEDQETITITLTADHFLYKMARNIVGTMIWIARGKLPLESIQSALLQRSRALAGMTAPAHGLSLIHIAYPKKMLL